MKSLNNLQIHNVPWVIEIGHHGKKNSISHLFIKDTLKPQKQTIFRLLKDWETDKDYNMQD